MRREVQNHLARREFREAIDLVSRPSVAPDDLVEISKLVKAHPKLSPIERELFLKDIAERLIEAKAFERARQVLLQVVDNIWVARKEKEIEDRTGLNPSSNPANFDMGFIES